MAVNYNGNIVTKGLVLCLDAANRRSYSGTGTTWYDLSGNNNNGTLTNGPTFSSSNRGSIVFDGINDKISVANIIYTTTNITNNFTYEIWCRPTATHAIDSAGQGGTGGTSGQRYLVWPQYADPGAGAGISIGTNGVSVYEHSAAYMPALLVHNATISSTIPSQIVIVYSGKTPILYINGVYIGYGYTSPKSSVYFTMDILCGDIYGYFQGTAYSFRGYNRSLSAAEVLQNFNAMRRRFGV